MIKKLVLVLIFASVASLTTPIIHGNGTIYITHKNAVDKSGVRFVYRPGYPAKCAEATPGLRAFVRFYSGVNETDDLTSYIPYISHPNYGVLMNWEHEGKYYWYDHNKGSVWPNRTFGYTVVMYNKSDDMIYIDKNKFYTVPETVKYCYLDTGARDSAYKCSYALDGYIDVPENSTPKESSCEYDDYEQIDIDKRNSPKINLAAVIGSVVGICCLIIIIAVVCIRRRSKSCCSFTET